MHNSIDTKVASANMPTTKFQIFFLHIAGNISLSPKEIVISVGKSGNPRKIGKRKKPFLLVI